MATHRYGPAELADWPTPAPGAFPFDAPVTCVYDYPDKPLSGVSPKFECAIKPGDVVKVKYGEDNGEVFAEVASSRLFWALGFPADRMYPVKVTCRNCPADPFKESKAEWHLGKSPVVSDKVFELATIERDFPGEKVEVPGTRDGPGRNLISSTPRLVAPRARMWMP